LTALVVCVAAHIRDGNIVENDVISNLITDFDNKWFRINSRIGNCSKKYDLFMQFAELVIDTFADEHFEEMFYLITQRKYMSYISALEKYGTSY
jgi:hypothetical protein